MRLWWVVLTVLLSSCRITADSVSSMATTNVDTEVDTDDGKEGNATAVGLWEDERMTAQDLAYDGDYYEYEDILSAYKLTYNTIYIIIAVFGIVGNALITITWSKVKQFNSTTFLLSFLGVCDFAFVFVMTFLEILLLAVETFTDATAWAFYLLVYVSYAAQYTSIFTTVVISITRYASVKFPFKVQVWFRKSIIKRICACIVLVSCIFAFPASTIACLFVYILRSAVENEPFDSVGNFTATAENASDVVTSGTGLFLMSSTGTDLMAGTITPSTFVDAYENSGGAAEAAGTTDSIEVCFFMAKYEKASLMTSVALINLVPWMVVIPMNLLLINQVRQSVKDRKRMMSKDEQNNVTMDVVVIILTLQSIVVYPICFLIELLTNKIDWHYYFGGDPPFPISDAESMHTSHLKDTLHVLNSSVNIVAYCACGRRFRKLLLEDVLKCGTTAKGEKAKPATKDSGVTTGTSSVSTVHGTSHSSQAKDSIGT